MVSIRSELSPWDNVTLDLWFRYIDRAKIFSFPDATHIQGYANFDLRVSWKPKNNLELSITGQNLLNSSHVEHGREYSASPTTVERGVYGKLNWRF